MYNDSQILLPVFYESLDATLKQRNSEAGSFTSHYVYTFTRLGMPIS